MKWDGTELVLGILGAMGGGRKNLLQEVTSQRRPEVEAEAH